MSANIQPPPTWAPVVDKSGAFNPVWLSWFLSVVNVLNQTGTGSGGINHNQLAGLQGGVPNQFYHLDNMTFNYVTNANSMGRQVSTAVAITGGTVDGTTIGATTPAPATVTNFAATGAMKFGTYTASVLAPTGYITITDAGGTSRRLLVG